MAIAATEEKKLSEILAELDRMIGETVRIEKRIEEILKISSGAGSLGLSHCSAERLKRRRSG